MNLSINIKDSNVEILKKQLIRYNKVSGKSLDLETYTEMVFLKGLIGMSEDISNRTVIRKTLRTHRRSRKLEDGSVIEFR